MKSLCLPKEKNQIQTLLFILINLTLISQVIWELRSLIAKLWLETMSSLRIVRDVDPWFSKIKVLQLNQKMKSSMQIFHLLSYWLKCFKMKRDTNLIILSNSRNSVFLSFMLQKSTLNRELSWSIEYFSWERNLTKEKGLYILQLKF